MFYGFESTDATHNQGTQIASMEQDANTAGQAVKTAAGQANPGGDEFGTKVQGGLDKFVGEANRAKGKVANEIRSLGENTTTGASTAQQTENDMTTAQNANDSSNSDIRSRVNKPMVV